MRWTLGLGAVAFPDYQGSQDYTAAPLWNIRAQNLYHPDTYAQLLGPLFTSNLIPDSAISGSGRWRSTSASAAASTTTRSTTCRTSTRRSCWAPSSATTSSLGEQRNLALEFLGRQDVANGNGFLGHAAGDLQDAARRDLATSLGLETTWASDDYMKAYFGVDSGDASRSGLDEYNADAGFKDVGANAYAELPDQPALGRDRDRRSTAAWSATPRTAR